MRRVEIGASMSTPRFVRASSKRPVDRLGQAQVVGQRDRGAMDLVAAIVPGGSASRLASGKVSGGRAVIAGRVWRRRPPRADAGASSGVRPVVELLRRSAPSAPRAPGAPPAARRGVDALLDAGERLHGPRPRATQELGGVVVGAAADLVGRGLGLADDPAALGLGGLA